MGQVEEQGEVQENKWNRNIPFRIKQSKEGLKEKPYNLSHQAAAYAQEKILPGLIQEFSKDLTFLQESILDNPINNSGKFDSVQPSTDEFKKKDQATAFAQEKILPGLIREFSQDLTFLQESILDNPINYSGKFVSVPFLYHHPEQYKKTSVNRFWNQLHQLPFKANSSMIQSHIK